MAAAYQVYSMYLWAALVALFLVLAIWVITIQARLNQLIHGYTRLVDDSEDGTLQDALTRYVERLDATTGQVEALDKLCHSIDANVGHAIQRIGVVRFNPFADTGSDQSFAVALLDLNGTGIVFSSLFSRTSTRIFAKPVVDGKSTHALTEEEQEAIEQAMTSTHTDLIGQEAG
ncbi:MAG: DUF4446 family protein [Chloroflexota bacterium]